MKFTQIYIHESPSSITINHPYEKPCQTTLNHIKPHQPKIFPRFSHGFPMDFPMVFCSSPCESSRLVPPGWCFHTPRRPRRLNCGVSWRPRGHHEEHNCDVWVMTNQRTIVSIQCIYVYIYIYTYIYIINIFIYTYIYIYMCV